MWLIDILSGLKRCFCGLSKTSVCFSTAACRLRRSPTFLIRSVVGACGLPLPWNWPQVLTGSHLLQSCPIAGSLWRSGQTHLGTTRTGRLKRHSYNFSRLEDLCRRSLWKLRNCYTRMAVDNSEWCNCLEIWQCQEWQTFIEERSPSFWLWRGCKEMPG